MARGDRALKVRRRADELISAFDPSLDAFLEARPFTGPSLHFHYRAIEHVRKSGSVSAALADPLTTEYIYATLASWGMHRIGSGGSKLEDFDRFRESLLAVEPALVDLERCRLLDLDDTSTRHVTRTLWRAIDQMKVSATQSKLVAGSKTLHHFLPDLIPPIDRQYTVQFFYGTAGKTLYMGEPTAFAEIYPQIVRIGQQCRGAIARYLADSSYMATGEAKVIDNAIIGFMLSEG